MENNEKEREIITTEEDMDKNNNEDRKFYVYEHIRKDNNTCFYVGKGTGDRAYNLNRSNFHNGVCKEYGCRVKIIKDGLTEKEAFALETERIEDYVITFGYGIPIEGYDDFSNNKYLTNFTWGGEGTSGLNAYANKTPEEMEEIRKKMSESHIGKKCSEEEKRNISEKMKGKNPYANKTSEEMEEIRKKMSESHKGIKMSEETKRKSSESHKGKLVGEKNGMWGKNPWNKGKEASEESRQKMSESHKGKKHSEEAKRKMSENNCRRHKVICITTGKIFDTIKDAEKYYSCGSISQCCKGKRKSAGKLSGWIELQWKYLEDYNNEFKGILINPIIK